MIFTHARCQGSLPKLSVAIFYLEYIILATFCKDEISTSLLYSLNFLGSFPTLLVVPGSIPMNRWECYNSANIRWYYRSSHYHILIGIEWESAGFIIECPWLALNKCKFYESFKSKIRLLNKCDVFISGDPYQSYLDKYLIRFPRTTSNCTPV